MGVGAGLRIAAVHARVGLLHELQYRVNLALQLVQAAISVGTALLVLALVFSYTDSLAGWSHDELLVLVAVHTMLGGFVAAAVEPNMLRLMQDVRSGGLDHALTKPADAQLLVSVRQFSLWSLADVLVGLGLLVYALVRLGRDASLADGLAAGLGFAVTLTLGGVLIYDMWLVLAASAFWFVRMDQVAELVQGLFAAGRFPISVYPRWLRGVLTFLVPLAFAVTVPAQALIGRLSPLLLLGAVAFAMGFTLLARLVWRAGLRRYSGASA